ARLGGARDSDVLAALPGLPLLPPAPEEAQVDAGEIVRGAAFTLLTLRSLALALAALPALEEPLAEVAPPLLRRAWKRVVAAGAAFAESTPEARHLLRKRLKRLRYASEFLLPMLPEKPARAALEAMRVALDVLGAYNDLVVAETRCRALGENDPKVAFALGWLAANRERLEARAAARLARLAEVPRFWRV
ncbi:MAG: CHAD domain-containing protein, partial [Burkholderiales bacterium]|nr:CHAD domain-containing protein [Burkholderiales bacterium]